MLELSSTLTQRYWAKVQRRGPGECWPWQASAHPFGHGCIFVGYDEPGHRSVNWNAHRVGWLLEYGVAPPGVVRHTCDWPPCQNPRHWVIGTQADNVRDMFQRGRARPHQAAPGELHHAAKLTAGQVVEIRRRVSEGQMQKQLAAEFHVSTSQVSRIVRGKRWAS